MKRQKLWRIVLSELGSLLVSGTNLITFLYRKDAMDAVKGSKGGRGDRIRSSSKERRRGSRESLTDSVHFEGDENPGIKTKIFHALGFNS